MPRLIIFDVDGTLVDSQAEILAAMSLAHAAFGLPKPDRAALLSVVGLSLPEGFAVLHPTLALPEREELAEAYRQSYFTLRTAPGAVEASFYPGMRQILTDLRKMPERVLAVATGKSRRGLDRLIACHGLENTFASTQVSDNHPSKPHPSMILAALQECDVPAEHAVMVGDTSFDMDMARAAGVRGIGVGWGYHEADRLGADVVVNDAQELRRVLALGEAA